MYLDYLKENRKTLLELKEKLTKNSELWQVFRQIKAD